MKKAFVRFLQAVVAASVASCASNESSVTSTDTAYLPSDDVMVLIKSAYPGKPQAMYDAVDSIAGFHDAQGLIDASSNKYGPAIGVYTGPDVRSPDELKQGAVVAILEVKGATSGATSYARLGVNSTGVQRYCVLLWSSEDQSTWKGAVVPAQATTCPSAAYDPSVYTMAVHRSSPFPNADDYPRVVRLDEDNNGPTIGVPCDEGWCDIANDSPSAKPPIDNDSGKAHEVRGWHDEQVLATAQGGLHPSSARASITPVDTLTSIGHDAFETAGSRGDTIGVIVAQVMLTGQPPTDAKYAKWGLKNGRSRLWIRHRASGYEAQFVQGGPNTEPSVSGWVQVNYVPHGTNRVPGVARWLWSPTDEGIWIACDQGCCEISES